MEREVPTGLGSAMHGGWGWQVPTLSKRPYSQMSCSRALVLMAMVNRTCATRSWAENQGKHQRRPGWGPSLGLHLLWSPQQPHLVHCGGMMLGLREEVKVGMLVFTAE